MAVAIKTSKKNQGFKDSKPVGKTRLLKRDSYPLAQLIVVITPVHTEDLHIARSRFEETFEDLDGNVGGLARSRLLISASRVSGSLMRPGPTVPHNGWSHS